MRQSPLVLALLLAGAGGVAAQPDALPVAPIDKAAASERGIYIVRFAEPALAAFRGDADRHPKLAGLEATSPAVTGERRLDVRSAASKAYLGALADLRDERLADAAIAFGRPLEPMFVYDVAFNGVALEFTAAEAAAMAGRDGVVAVERDRLHTPQTDAGPRWIGADAIWNAAAPIGNRGEGVVIGIIDSGINPTHPSFAARASDGHLHVNPLGRQLGVCEATPTQCNTKLVGMHDFTLCTGTHAGTGCDDREANNGIDVNGHGSHVSGIAAGNPLSVTLTSGAGGSVTRQISGVAPRANLVLYKGCEKEETCRGTWLLAAVNQATADGVDVINYSIGGEPRNPWQDSLALAMLTAREAGAVVVAAAGNDGPAPGTVTSTSNAPWVISVANASHDRAVVNVLEDLTGGATPPPGNGTLVGVGNTAGVGPAPIVYAGNFGSALCATGTDVDATPPSTSTNPWPTPVFSGQIVVCDRGTYARVIKGQNVRNAGAAGMVLVNGENDGELVSDSHVLPATHLGYDDGVALKQWLSTGTGHRGRISGSTFVSRPEFGNVLSQGSGRGPVLPFGAMKPNVTAPGTGIIAAGVTGSGLATMSGTSMASPHVAGAAALLRGAHPSWQPSDVETALSATADPVAKDWDGTDAGIFDQGAGVVDLADAVKSGLSFPVTRSQFLDADIGSQSVSKNLNLPSLVDANCVDVCVFSRTVKALVGGTWDASSTFGSAALIEPARFTLAPNETQVLRITVDVSLGDLGKAIEGDITFTPTDNGIAATRVPVALVASPGAAPAPVQIVTRGESGFRDIAVSGLIGLPQAVISPTQLVTPTRATLQVTQDTTSDDPFDNLRPADAGTKWILVNANGNGRARVIARASSSTAQDIDLFVGMDRNGDGVPQESELLCSAKTSSASEQCTALIEDRDFSSEDAVWVLPQNWRAPDATGAASTDTVRVEAAVISFEPHAMQEFVASGPGRTLRDQPFTIRAAWDVPDLLPGQTRWALVLLSTRVPADPSPVLDPPAGAAGDIFVELTRAQDAIAAPQMLEEFVERRIALAPGQAQDRLYVDLPANIASISVTASGTGDYKLYLSRDTSPSSPGIDAAPPRDAAVAVSTRSNASEVLSYSGDQIGRGRWYVTPVNTGSTSAEFTLRMQLGYQGTPSLAKFGPYFNPARSGAGIFMFPVGDSWGLAWYTYLQDGTPTWYLGVADQNVLARHLRNVKLQRFSWDGSTAQGVVVGEAQLAFDSDRQFTFSWNLDGESGSEPMTWIDGGGCPTLNGAPAALSGLWFSPDASGFGYSISAYPGLESNGAYFYDGLGLARWAIGSRSPFAGGEQTFVLSQQNGPCPLCTYRVPTGTDIGTLTRSFTDASNGRIAVDLELAAPTSGSWTVDLPVIRASSALTCP